MSPETKHRIASLTRWYNSYHRVPLTERDLWTRIGILYPYLSQHEKQALFRGVTSYNYKHQGDPDLRPTREHVVYRGNRTIAPRSK